MMLGNLLIAKGSGVFYDEPGSLSFHTYLRTLGGRMRGIGLDRHGIITSNLIGALKENKSGILYTMPVYPYPSGITTSKARKSEVLKVAVNANMPIVELDTFRELDRRARQCFKTPTAAADYLLYNGELKNAKYFLKPPQRKRAGFP